jgi:uncharacterized membrane protein (UPF0127 family)
MEPPRISVPACGRLRICNCTRGTVLASKVEIADSFCTRLVGLLGRSRLSPGSGLWLLGSNSIHTFGMRFPIDLVMLNRNAMVIETRESVAPFSFVWPNFRASSVLELPAATIAKTSTACGDLLRMEIAGP